MPYYPTNKISTSPVPLNSPAGTDWATTGDTYSATITYDGSNLTMSLYDVTTGGSCPGSSCFTHTWTDVYIPSVVGATTAYVGFTGGINSPNLPALYVNAWSYTQNTPTGTPTFTAWNAGSTYHNGTVSTASPTYSIAPGTYIGTQTVSLSSSTSNSNICYVLSAATPTLLPQVDNAGKCAAGTAYSGRIAISSTSTLYAMAGTTFTNPPSTLVAGTYTITGTQAAQAATPSFSPVAGMYPGTQSVTISDATPDATIYYTTNGTAPTTSSTQYTGPIKVSSTETLKAIAVAAGDSNSAVASAAYTITPQATVATPTFSPAAGTYTSAQSVSLSDVTSDATIYYTTNGTKPTTSSTQYTGPITVSSTETLKAIAVAAGDTTSAVASAPYTINSIGVGSPMTCLPLQSVPGSPGMLQTTCTIVLTP